jgi:hypothetical protein
VGVGFCREQFRKDYKEKHPNVKQVSVVSVVFLRCVS